MPSEPEPESYVDETWSLTPSLTMRSPDSALLSCHPTRSREPRSELPAYAPYEVNAASALIAGGRKSEALRHLERAVHLDPLLQQAVELLSSLYRDEGESAKAAWLIAQYRREMGFDPAR